MTQVLYKVILSGEMHDDFDKDTVVQELVTLFKCPEDKAASLIAGKPTKLKRELPKDKAEKYCNRLGKVGVKCVIEMTESSQQHTGLSLEPVSENSSEKTAAALSMVPSASEESSGNTESDLLAGTSLSLEPVALTTQSEQPENSQKVAQTSKLVVSEVVTGTGNIVCPKCQAEQSKADQCIKCGVFIEKYLARLQADKNNQEEVQNVSTDEAQAEEETDDMHDLALFVGDKFDDKYRLRFSEIIENDGKVAKDFNWAAALIAVPWMVHRKMYLFAAGYFLVGSLLPSWLSLAMGIAMGIFGTHIYYRFAQYQIGKMTSTGIDRDNEIVAKGGVLSIPVVIGILISGSLLASIIFYSLFMGPSMMDGMTEMNDDLASFDKSVDKEAALGLVSLKAAINMHIALERAGGGDIELPLSVGELQKKYKISSKLFYDKWQTSIEYKRNTTGYSLTSAGPDEQIDTEDDIVVKSIISNE